MKNLSFIPDKITGLGYSSLPSGSGFTSCLAGARSYHPSSPISGWRLGQPNTKCKSFPKKGKSLVLIPGGIAFFIFWNSSLGSDTPIYFLKSTFRKS